MYFKNETSRDSFKRPLDKLREVFGETKGFADAEYLDAGRTRVFGVDGLPMKAPVCMFLLGRTEVLCWLDAKDGDVLVTYGDSVTEGGRPVPEDVAAAVRDVVDKAARGAGYINERGEHVIDLKGLEVGTHYTVNLLLGRRIGFDKPMLTTPKASLDSFGRGAFRAGGRVVGVLGCGIDVVYPASNERLFWDVKNFGALVSEYPPGTRPDKGYFPARNRIMSGLSLGVVVVEAPERSGALITASRALEQGRDVFAVPGNVDARSCRGSNNLLKEGAQPVTGGIDVMENYAARFPEKFKEVLKLYELDKGGLEAVTERELKETGRAKTNAADKSEQKPIDKEENRAYIDISVNPEEYSETELSVLKALEGQTLHVDTIAEKSGQPMSDVLSALTILEISGAVTQEPGKRFKANIKV